MKYLYTKINNNHLNRNDMSGIVAGCTGCNIGKHTVRGYVIAYEAIEVVLKSVAVITMGEFIPWVSLFSS